MRTFVETRFGIVMVLTCVLALLYPYGHLIPKEALIPVLASTTFLSYYRVEVKCPMKLVKQSLAFSVVRFAALPLLLWYIARLIAPDYALSVLLISLLPAGVSSAAFTQLFGGHVALALVVTVVSSVLSIFLIPFVLGIAAQHSVHIDIAGVTTTLLLCIAAPMILYRLLRNSQPLQRFAHNHGKFTSILLIATIVFIVITKARNDILADPMGILVPFFVATCCFAAAGLVGMMWRTDYDRRVALCVTSVFNNAALGVSLALMHFGTTEVFVTVAGELLWALLPLPLQLMFNRRAQA